MLWTQLMRTNFCIANYIDKLYAISYFANTEVIQKYMSLSVHCKLLVTS